MSSPGQALRALQEGRASSVLVSGGCDPPGTVPFMEHLPLLEQLRELGRVNLHSGLAGPREAQAIAGRVDVVSLDMVGDDDTVREVYGHQRGARAYQDAYLALRQHVRVVPHLCIGLRGGDLGHEYRVLDFLKREGVEHLVLLVFIPTRGTRYGDAEPPPLKEVQRVVLRARTGLPSATLSLGCMRPGARYRSDLDTMALREGIDEIVNPSPPALRLAMENGFEVSEKWECCCL
jgi:uncharacterized radical SAM superfamily protein